MDEDLPASFSRGNSDEYEIRHRLLNYKGRNGIGGLLSKWQQLPEIARIVLWELLTREEVKCYQAQIIKTLYLSNNPSVILKAITCLDKLDDPIILTIVDDLKHHPDQTIRQLVLQSCSKKVSDTIAQDPDQVRETPNVVKRYVLFGLTAAGLLIVVICLLTFITAILGSMTATMVWTIGVATWLVLLVVIGMATKTMPKWLAEHLLGLAKKLHIIGKHRSKM